MRRIMTMVALAALLTVPGAGSALAQTKEMPPEETGTVEPAPAWYVDVSVGAILVDGEEADRVPIGTPAKLRFHATNTSDKTANDVTVALEAPANTTLSDRSLSFGDIASQGNAEATTTIRITSEENCQDYLGWVGTLRSSLGEQMVKFGVSVDCPGPRLGIEKWEFVGGDGDDIPEPGETLQIFLTYRNDGRDPATDVRATMTTGSGGVTVTDGASVFGTVAANSTQRATDPFTIEIAKDAPLQDSGCGAASDGPPAEDTGSSGGTVSSDGTVSPDGSTSSDGSTTPSCSGSGSAGSSGTADSEPSSTGEEPREAPAPGEVPADEPAPDGGRYAQQEPSVAVEGQLKVTSDQISFEDMFSNQMACIMMDSARGAPAGSGGTTGVGAPEADGKVFKGALATGARSSSSDRGGSIVVAAVLLMAIGSQVGWRLMRERVSAR